MSTIEHLAWAATTPEEDLLVHNFVWYGNTHAEGRTNFVGFMSLAGVKTVLGIDPDARLSRMLTLHERQTLDKTVLVYADFATVEGNEQYFEALYNSGSFSRDYPLYAHYEVECSLDSPLIGWFLVLGAKDGRSSLSDRRGF